LNITLKNNSSGKEINGFHSLNVISITHVTSDSVMICFEIPTEIRSLYSFKPGQHVELLLYEGNEELRRTYSICSGANEPLSIGVKALKSGKVSSFLNSAISVGDEILVSQPRGSFVLNTAAKNIAFFGAGSGITPLLSMMKTCNETSINSTLIYGNKELRSIMFRDEIDQLADRVYHFLSVEKKEGFGYGRVNRENISELIINDRSLIDADAFYICGPASMIADVCETLQSFGVSDDLIHFEYFSAPIENKSSDQATLPSFSGNCKVQVKLEGDKFQFDVSADGSVLLEAARKAGLEAPFSCKTGICGSCRAKIKNGTVSMKANYALTAEEVEQGYILTCQAQPTCSDLSISFDD
jgi:ring-1,2-phenylacetyl-CoA epoxidase subunit PaaE